jgi:dipeptidyl aminopeptidase/acylaminoacyl peptidase
MKFAFSRVVILAALLAWVTTLSSSHTTAAERLTPEKLTELARLGDAAVSPDGKKLAFLVTNIDLAANSGRTSLMLLELPDGEISTSGKSIGFDSPLVDLPTKQLLTDMRGLNSLNWIRRPQGDMLLYAAPTSGENSTMQAWLLDPAGGEPVQITEVADGIANLKPSPTGDAIAFTVDIKMDATVNEIYPDLPKADARIIDSLLYRHWNAWHDYAYTHVHVARLGEDGQAADPIDLMGSLKADSPLPPFGGAEQFAFSPDGKEMALTLKLVKNPAESTDSGIYLVSTSGGPLKAITPGMPGYDMEPRYSPDGRYLAFHSMERASFESDRNRIMLYDRTTGHMRELTSGLDQTAHNATWSHDSRQIYFTSETRGTTQAYAIGIDSPQVKQLSSGWFDFAIVSEIPNTAEGSTRLLLRQQNMLRPIELAIYDRNMNQLFTITDLNGKIFANLELPKIEERFFTATDGKQIQNWVILPPDFDSQASKQWPMLTYCQGGPQGQIGQWFSYRWNFHTMAAHGYVVLAVNRRGLPGFGQEWNDQISGDWGGQAMQDILAATDGMLADPKIDRDRVAAVGASFGGYTVYWLMGNARDRFCAMVSHCGVFNLESMYGSTEELFFVNFDLGGPYWSSSTAAEAYARFSPHRFVGKWKTPLLVIHGEKDFRVPVTQGMEAFTAAQVQGVPSRFLYFPEEGHWVLSPQNGVLWSRVFFDWLDRYCK